MRKSSIKNPCELLEGEVFEHGRHVSEFIEVAYYGHWFVVLKCDNGLFTVSVDQLLKVWN